MLGTSLAAMAVQIVSTPIHNGCPALLQVEEAGKQAVKDSNLRFCCVLFFLLSLGFHLLGVVVAGIRKPGKPKTKCRVVVVVFVALRGIAAYKSFYFPNSIIGVCPD